MTATVGFAAVTGWDHLLAEQALATTPIHETTLSSLVQQVRQARGHMVVLALYDPHSDDAYTVADLRRWAVQSRSPRVELLAFAVGARRDAQFLFRYGEEQGVQRLPPEWLAQSEPAMLDSTLAELGIKQGAGASFPVTAIFDSTGKVTAQWVGELQYHQVLRGAKASIR